MNILLTESQLKHITEILVGVDTEKLTKIKNFISDFKNYERKDIYKLVTYSSVPRRFHDGKIFGQIVYNYYTKKGGQFYFISTGVRKYIILLLNDKLVGLDSKGDHADLDRLERIMELSKWGLTLKEVLTSL